MNPDPHRSPQSHAEYRDAAHGTSLWSRLAASARSVRKRPIRVLALAGGGYQGLYAAHVLARLEELAGGEPIGRQFDLIAGTSAGGIVAVAAALEIPMATVAQTFAMHGPLIFPERRSALGKARELLASRRHARYSSRALRRAITSLTSQQLALADVLHPLVVPALDMSAGEPRIFRGGYGSGEGASTPLVDIIMASTAAPVFFELAEIGEQLLVDGGLFANAPELLAMHEAEAWFDADHERMQLLAVGTPGYDYSFRRGMRRDLGYQDWLAGLKLIKTSLSAQQQICEMLTRQRLGTRYVRLRHQTTNPQGQAPGFDVTGAPIDEFLQQQALADVGVALAGPLDWLANSPPQPAPVAEPLPSPAGRVVTVLRAGWRRLAGASGEGLSSG